MELEDKIRRRLAPFVVEGKIAAPQFSSGPDARHPVTINVQLKLSGVEADVQSAMSDLASEAHLVFTPAV